MKKILIAILITVSLAPLVSIAQTDTLPVNKETGLVDFTDVVTVDSASASKLYSNARIFVASVFNSGKAVTELTDEGTNTVIGNAKISVIMRKTLFFEKSPGGWFKFRLTIQCKEGKYKYSFTNFDHIGYPVEGFRSKDLGNIEKPKLGVMSISLKQWNDYKSQVNSIVQSMIDELKRYMTSHASQTKDW